MEDLKDTLDQSKWVKMDESQKQGFQDFQVMRQHRKVSPTCFGYLIQMEEDTDSRKVTLDFTVKDKDPLKNIGTAELLVKDDKIVGIDLGGGDCYQLK